MGKVMNIFFGIGVAVLVYVVVLLGIQAFYPSVSWDDYNCTYPMAKDLYTFQGCSTNMTVGECLDYRSRNPVENLTQQEIEYNQCNDRFQADMEDYNKNFFLIATIVGALAIILATLLIPMTNISVGVSFAGLVLIIWGFIRSWTSTGDTLKFIVAIIIAAIVIWLGVRYNNRK